MGRDRREPAARRGVDTAVVAGKRRPPPEGTGAESQYLDECVAAQKMLRVELRDGRSWIGRIAGHDRDLVELRTDGGPEIVVRKNEIRLLVESDSES